MSSNSPEISQEFAQRLFAEGAAVVLLNVPPGTEIGIDLHSWNVGHKFKGIKMIPPGLHFIYYSAVSKQGQTAPRTGFFHYFNPKEVLVKMYLPETEDFKQESAEQSERIRADLRNLDSSLGSYPLDSWRRWVSLTHHITQEYIDTVIPATGVICSVPEMLPVDDPSCSSTANSDARKRHKTQHSGHDTGSEDTVDGTKSMDTSSHTTGAHHEDTDTTSHTNILTSLNSCSSNIKNDNFTIEQSPNTNSEIKEDSSRTTTDAIDSPDTEQEHPDSSVYTATAQPSVRIPRDQYCSAGLPDLVPVPGTDWRWPELPKRPFRSGATPAEVTAASMDSSYVLECLFEKFNSPSDVISELQLSFTAFLVCQSWGGWERWKQLLAVLCKAEKALLQHTDVFSKVMAAVHFQIQEVPEDLFVDIVEHENFMAASLATLFANISDNSARLPTALVDRARKFRVHLTARFGWDFDLDGNEDDAPVVVQL